MLVILLIVLLLLLLGGFAISADLLIKVLLVLAIVWVAVTLFNGRNRNL